MKLTEAQLAQFHDDGYLFLPDWFDADEMRLMKAEVPAIFAQRRPENVREKTGDVVRTAFAVHTYNEVFRRLVQHPRVPGARRADARRARLHPSVQDQRQGGLRRRRVAVAPGLRHLGGRRRHARAARHEPGRVPRRGHRVQRAAAVHPALAPARASSRPATTSAPPAIRCGPSTTRRSRAWPTRAGWWLPRGGRARRCSSTATSCTARPPNMSPWGREIVYVSLNRVDNAIRRFKRPEWIAHRDFAPLAALGPDCLRELAQDTAPATS